MELFDEGIMVRMTNPIILSVCLALLADYFIDHMDLFFVVFVVIICLKDL